LQTLQEAEAVVVFGACGLVSSARSASLFCVCTYMPVEGLWMWIMLGFLLHITNFALPMYLLASVQASKLVFGTALVNCMLWAVWRSSAREGSIRSAPGAFGGACM
jgi:hypothetical protein